MRKKPQISLEDFSRWKDEPITELFFKAINDRVKDLENGAYDYLLAEEKSRAMKVGQRDAYLSVLDFTHFDLMEEEDDE